MVGLPRCSCHLSQVPVNDKELDRIRLPHRDGYYLQILDLRNQQSRDKQNFFQAKVLKWRSRFWNGVCLILTDERLRTLNISCIRANRWPAAAVSSRADCCHSRVALRRASTSATKWVKKSSPQIEFAGDKIEYHWYEHPGIGRFEVREVEIHQP